MQNDPNPRQEHGSAHDDGDDSQESTIAHASDPSVQETETEEDQDDPPKQIKYIFDKTAFAYRWLEKHWPGKANSWTAWGTWLAVIAATIYAGIAALQLHEMRKATVAATSSAITAKETMIRSERPWIGNVGGEEVKINIVNTNTVVGNMKFLAKNFGPSPGLNVGVGAFPFIRRTGDTKDFTEARKQACMWAETNALVLGDSIFPQETRKYDAVILSPVEGIEKVDRMLFAGCIAYRDQFDTTHATHHTSFCMMGEIKHLGALYNCGTGDIAD